MKKPARPVRKKSSAKAAKNAGGTKAGSNREVSPGEIMLGEGDVIALHGRETLEVTVSNTGDRPIQVGSHCHFFEVNRALKFDRERAYGFRLQVPAGTAVRFEPGEAKRVMLVALGGNRVAYGINGLVNGKLDDPEVKGKALGNAKDQGFITSSPQPSPSVRGRG